MKRTTIRMNEGVLAEAKQYAVKSGRSLTAVIEDAVREMLARRRSAPKKQKFTMVTFGGKGVRPGVDLNDSAALRDLMDEGLPLDKLR